MIQKNPEKKYKVIVTGATGMVGEGVAFECLQHPQIEEVLLVNRRPSGWSHPKLREIVHADLMNLTPVESQLKGYDACFFCLGTTSLGKSEKTYTRTTYDLTLHVAATLLKMNPSMTFCYISGSGTDSSEKGSVMWARVKGKTENALLHLGFQRTYNFRPAVLTPTPGLKNTLPYYHYLGWLLPLIRTLAPNYITTLKELGQAMIAALLMGFDKHTIEVKDIKTLAKKYNEDV